MNFTEGEKAVIQAYRRGEIDFREAARRYPKEKLAAYHRWDNNEAVLNRAFRRWEQNPAEAPWWLRWLYR